MFEKNKNKKKINLSLMYKIKIQDGMTILNIATKIIIIWWQRWRHISRVAIMQTIIARQIQVDCARPVKPSQVGLSLDRIRRVKVITNDE